MNNLTTALDTAALESLESTPLLQNTHEFSKSDGLTFAKSRRMTRTRGRGSVSILTMLVSASLSAQTRIEPRKNSFTPSEDVQLGRRAAADVRQQLPLLRDRPTDALVDGIGRRLVASVPVRFQQPAFRYSFDVVNLREINAFA